MQTEEMLRLRAALEGKLGSNEVLRSTVSKSDKAQKRTDRKLKTFDDFTEQVKQKQEAKRAAKAEIYSRKPHLIPSWPERVDGKRLIPNKIPSSRGLTRQRNKYLKTPRTKYRNKHMKKVIRHRGQVRGIRTQMGPYAGETRGINPNTSRSIRIKN